MSCPLVPPLHESTPWPFHFQQYLSDFIPSSPFFFWPMWPHHPFPRGMDHHLDALISSIWFFRTGLKGSQKVSHFSSWFRGHNYLYFLGLFSTWGIMSEIGREKLSTLTLFHSICSPTQDSVFPPLILLSQNQWPNSSSMSLATFIAALLSPFGWFLQLVLQTPRLLTLLSLPNLFFTSTSLLPQTQSGLVLPHPRVQGSRLTSPALNHSFPGPTKAQIHSGRLLLLNCPQALVTGDGFSSQQKSLASSLLPVWPSALLTDTGSWAV